VKEQITPGGCFTARFGRQMGRRFAALHPSTSSAGTRPRHSAPPRYVSEKLVPDSTNSVSTETSDGQSGSAAVAVSPVAEHSAPIRDIVTRRSEGASLASGNFWFDSEAGSDDGPLQPGRDVSSKARNSRSDCSVTDIVGVDYDIRATALHKTSAQEDGTALHINVSSPASE